MPTSAYIETRVYVLAVLPRPLHARLDEASAAALDVLGAASLSDSQAVLTALREAAERRHSRSALREEVRRLADDPAGREEQGTWEGWLSRRCRAISTRRP